MKSINLAAAMLLFTAGRASAVLLGFETDDGYVLGPRDTDPFNPVVMYNAGEYGANSNNPSGSYQSIAMNTGLWRDLNNITPVSVSGPNNADRYYTVAHDDVGQFAPRSGDQFLVINNFQSINAEMRYSLDSADFGGVVPTNTSSHLMKWSIYACAVDPTEGVGFFWTFRDSNENVAMQIGWNTENELQYRTNLADAWTVDSSVLISSTAYDLFEISINTYTDTYSFSVGGSSIVTDVATSQSLVDFALIDWTVPGTSRKVSFDDSTFDVTAVPEPSTAVSLAALASALLVGFSRKNRKQLG